MRNPFDTLKEAAGSYEKWGMAKNFRTLLSVFVINEEKFLSMKCFTEQWQSWSSDRLISFHHVKPEGFYMLEFLTERQWQGELKVP